jgi:hypothetical protein
MGKKKHTYKELQDAFYAGMNCPVAGATFEEYLQCHNSEIIKYDFELLEKYKDRYDFNLLLTNGSYAIFITKQDVDLFSTDGESIEDVVKRGYDYLERINKNNN